MANLRTAVSAAGMCAVALWTFPAFADDIPGAKPGDVAMTCDQIGAEDKPLHDQMNAQTNAVVAQGTAIGSDARVQRLMQLAQEKNCH